MTKAALIQSETESNNSFLLRCQSCWGGPTAGECAPSARPRAWRARPGHHLQGGGLRLSPRHGTYEDRYRQDIRFTAGKIIRPNDTRRRLTAGKTIRTDDARRREKQNIELIESCTSSAPRACA